MQYLLTEEEYKALEARASRNSQLPDEKQLQALCTKIANEMPVKLSWRPNAAPEPWGCILNQRPLHDPRYCDHCPVEDICPHEFKEWSK